MHKTITKYLEEVCVEIKYKKAHEKIVNELSSHIYDLMDNYMYDGMSEDEAAIKAILQMGNAKDIGKALNQTHKPKIEWKLITLVSMTTIIGLISLFSIANDPAFWNLDLYQFTKSYSVYGGLGVIIFTICLFFDYTKLEKYSMHIYIGSMILLFISSFSHNTINGLSTIMVGSFRFTPVSYILAFGLVSYSGLVKRWGNGDVKGIVKLIVLAIIAISLCMIQPSAAKAMLLATGFLVLITKAILSHRFTGNKKAFLSIIYGGGFVSTLFLFMTATEYQLMRLNVFKYKDDPLGKGYAYYMSQKVKEGARLFGKGDGLYINHSGINDIVGLPEANTDFILTYIISAFGWIVGILLTVILTLLIIRMFIATKKIHTIYGGYLSSGILTVFTLQIMINILMNFGLFPYIGMGLPFVSYGGANFVTNMALVGLFLGIYRRKDIVENKIMQRSV